jgi:hypothetical protein
MEVGLLAPESPPWIEFDDYNEEVLQRVLQTRFSTGEVTVPFTVRLTNDPIYKVIVNLHQDRIEYVAPAEFPTAEQRDRMTNRWLSTRPLFQRVKELYPWLTGSCRVWLRDEPSGTGLAFCGNGVGHVLIPDPTFLGTAGYAKLRAFTATAATPWAARSPVIFWRGSSSGQYQPRWLHTPRRWQDLPRLKLCLEVKTIGRDDLFDVGISRLVGLGDDAQIWREVVERGLVREPCPPTEFGKYKFAIDVDGNTCSWPGLFTKFLMNNTVIKVDSERGFRQWYYDRLVPWHNFVPLSASMEELLEIATWLREHLEEAEQIGARARELAASLTFDRVLSDIAPAVRDQISAPQLL